MYSSLAYSMPIKSRYPETWSDSLTSASYKVIFGYLFPRSSREEPGAPYVNFQAIYLFFKSFLF